MRGKPREGSPISKRGYGAETRRTPSAVGLGWPGRRARRSPANARPQRMTLFARTRIQLRQIPDFGRVHTVAAARGCRKGRSPRHCGARENRSDRSGVGVLQEASRDTD